ncbi:MAG TPA: isochorismatase [Ruminococcus sp.]|nr:isochorismatase [Ruminococcus sp.]
MPDHNALLVIELQNDFLWEQRKEKFPYPTEALIQAVNAEIDARSADGWDVIYIAQIFPDTPSNHIIFDFCIEGTEGAKLYSGLHVASELYFEKNVADTFLAKDFAAFMEQQGYSHIELCGTDEAGSIAATAKGALKTGAAVSIRKNCVASRFPANKLAPIRYELKTLGVQYV